MLIDRTHRQWFWTSIIGVAIGLAIYIPYAHFTIGGARGGTVPGIIFGSIGFGFMIFA